MFVPRVEINNGLLEGPGEGYSLRKEQYVNTHGFWNREINFLLQLFVNQHN